MGKLHELLAVEPGKKQAFENILNEATQTFSNKPDHFRAAVKTLEMTDGSSDEIEVTDRHAMTTTVQDKLEYVADFVEDYFDIVLQKEISNQGARASVIIGEDIIVKDAPVTFLLGLEQKLARLRDVFKSIPTHAPGIEWIDDPTFEFKGVVKAKFPSLSDKTKKVIKPFVLYEATDKHPAQVEKLTEDVKVGRYTTNLWSGMFSPAQKSDLLSRVDTLLEAVKTARMQANDSEASTSKVGSAIMGYILP